MRFSSLRFFVFVCIAALCLPIGCKEDSAQPKKEGYNFLSKKNTTPAPRLEVKRKGDSEWAQRFARRIRDEFDSEKQETGKAVLHYGLFLAGLAILIAGLLWWRMQQQKRMQWEQNDPMALVKELNYVHQLSEPEKQFMQELSDQNALSSPLDLFVEPKFLLEAWESDSFTSSRPTVRQLLLKLFNITADGNALANTTAAAFRSRQI